MNPVLICEAEAGDGKAAQRHSAKDQPDAQHNDKFMRAFRSLSIDAALGKNRFKRSRGGVGSQGRAALGAKVVRQMIGCQATEAQLFFFGVWC